MDQRARCGMTAHGSLVASPAQKRAAACSVSGAADATFAGHEGRTTTLQVTGALSGLDASKAYPDAGAIGYASDPIGAFTAAGRCCGDDMRGSLTTALEFDNSNSVNGSPSAQARRAVFLAE